VPCLCGGRLLQVSFQCFLMDGSSSLLGSAGRFIVD